MLRSMLQQITEEALKKHEKPGIKNRGLGPEQSHCNQSRLSPDYTPH